MISRAFVLSKLLFLLAGTELLAQTAENQIYGPRPVQGERVKKQDAVNFNKYKGSPDLLVLPGLLANRKEKKIELLAESTGLKENEIAEFLVLNQNSGHGYEALFWAFSKPSDVHKALVFIGIRPGDPFNPRQLRLHPKGELINVSVLKKDGTADAAPVMIENFILDKNTGKPLPESGFLFTGSIQVPAPAGQTELGYAADLYDPKSIVSLFNNPATVFDVPRQANQEDVYSSQVVNPAYVFTANELLTLILEPARKDDTIRIKNLVLDVEIGSLQSKPAATTSKSASSTNSLNFLLKDSDGSPLGKGSTLEDALTAFADLKSKGVDSYLSVRFGNTLKLSEVRDACLFISMLEFGFGISVEPPAQGQLYYKAFLPDDAWRKRENRPSQPWELRLIKSRDMITGTLFQNETIGNDAKTLALTIKTTSFAVPTPQALRAKLDADAKQRTLANQEPAFPVLLVFTSEDLSYGDLMRFIEPVLSTHNIIRVFLPQKGEKNK